MRSTAVALGLTLLLALPNTDGGAHATEVERALQQLRELIGVSDEGTAWPATRSYDPRVLTAGEKLFRRNCAVCHGWNAEGTVAEWQQRDAAGNYPPPPLNGTAHTWHHPTSVLLRIVKEGTRPLGGSMPPFGDKLSDAQIVSIIQWLTSLWPANIYAMWAERSERE